MKRRWKVVLGILALILVIVAGALEFLVLRESVYQEFVSPDQNYKLVVYTIGNTIAAPGQSGDRRGVVRLVDRKGQVINAMDLDMASLIYQPEWSASRVEERVILDWELPPVEK